MEQKLAYKDALAELQSIVRKVETSEIDVDELAVAVKKANQLITYCREKLRTADAEVAIALSDMSNIEPAD